MIHRQHSIEMRKMTGPEETVCSIRSKRPYTLLFRFVDGRYDDLLLFLAQQTLITCMRIQCQDSNARFLHSKITLETIVEQRQFCQNPLLCDLRRDIR